MEDHPHIRAALRKLQVGVPPQAVRAELVKRRLNDPSFVDDPENVNLDTPLPEELQTQPVRVEFTEIYLDERAFMEHAGSRDYLDGYGVVMNPALHYTTPMTVRLGTPPASIVEKILEPILNENVAPLPEGCTVWQWPSSGSDGDGNALFMSLDVTDMGPEDVVSRVPSDFRDHCTTFVAFTHPLRAGTTRIMCVLPSLPSLPILTGLAALQLARGEVHMDNEDSVQCVRDALDSAGMGFVTVNASEKVGYALHEQAADIRSKDM